MNGVIWWAGLFQNTHKTIMNEWSRCALSRKKWKWTKNHLNQKRGISSAQNTYFMFNNIDSVVLLMRAWLCFLFKIIWKKAQAQLFCDKKPAPIFLELETSQTHFLTIINIACSNAAWYFLVCFGINNDGNNKGFFGCLCYSRAVHTPRHGSCHF